MTSIYKGSGHGLPAIAYPRIETKRPVGEGCPWCKTDRSCVLHTHVKKFTIGRDGRPLREGEEE